jgi:hypothetical protein
MNVPAAAASECFDWRDPRIIIQDHLVCVVLYPRRMSHWWDLTVSRAGHEVSKVPVTQN